MPNDDTAKIWSFMKDIGTCMLVSRDGSALRARPMAAMPREEEGAVWFFTDVRAHKDDELRADPHVCLAFAQEDDKTYVSVSGTAELLDDRAKAKEMWSTPAQAYFPGGPTDPNLRLLRVTPDSAEYWDATSSSIVTAVKMVAARIRGDKPDLGDNRKVAL